MRFKLSILLALFATILLSSSAFADNSVKGYQADPAAKSAPATIHRDVDHNPSGNLDEVLAGADFNDGVFPPTGWTHGVTNAANTWQQLVTEASVEGLCSAYIRWDSYVPQNETLEFTYPIDVGANEFVLSFYMAGSVGQAWDLNDVMTVEINGTPVWDFDSSVVVGYMVFDQYFIDFLAAFRLWKTETLGKNYEV